MPRNGTLELLVQRKAAEFTALPQVEASVAAENMRITDMLMDEIGTEQYAHVAVAAVGAMIEFLPTDQFCALLVDAGTAVGYMYLAKQNPEQ